MKNRKFYFAVLFFLCLAAIGLTDSKNVSAKTGSGPCGDNASWKYDTETEKLELFGTGVVKEVVHVKKKMHLKRKGFNVRQLVIHEGITSVKNGIFENVLFGGGEISLPDSFQKIPSGMLQEFFIESLFIPKNVSVIEEPAFWGQSILKKVTVSPQNQHYCSIDGVLFTKDVSKLVYYPEGRKRSFYHIPDSVTKIAPLAFCGNSYLKEVKIPVGLEELGGGAFYHCTMLESVNISELYKLKRIKDFRGRSSFFLGKREYTLAYRDHNTTGYNGYFESNDDDSTEKYGSLGTFACTSLRSFVMPDNLQYIASETFRDDIIEEFSIGRNFIGGINSGKEFTQTSVNLYYVRLRRLTLNEENKKYRLDGNILYTKDKKILCYVVSDKRCRKETLVIGKKTKEIGHGAFSNVSIYHNIVVKGDLDRIGVSAFAESKIKTFRVEGTVRKIMMGAFYNSKVRKWEYNGGLTSIPANAFACSDLEWFDFHSEVTDIGNSAFYACTYLKEVSGMGSVKKLGNYVFGGYTPLKTLELINLESGGDGIIMYDEDTKVFIPETAVLSEWNNNWVVGNIIRIPSKKTIGKYTKVFSFYMLGMRLLLAM